VAAILFVILMAASPAAAQTGADREPRIIGGNTTTSDEWPWQVAIDANPARFSGNGFQRQFCGGSLVAPTVVITAAHCAFDVFDNNNAFDDPGNFSVITGRTTLSDSSQGQEIPVSSIWVPTDASGHHLYNDNTSQWDAVAMFLSSGSNSAPIKIAGPGETGLWAPGSAAWATGWGATALMGPGSNGSDTLREVQVHIVSDSSCSLSYPGEFDPETMVCAGEPSGGKDTCFGDSGGPLVVPMSGGFRLVGDTSWGNQCALPNQPGVYGRLAADPMRSAFRNQIFCAAGVDIVGAGEPGPPDCGGAGTSSDNRRPKTKITKHPRKHVHGDQERILVTFKFKSDEPGSSFRCRLDKRPLRKCSSPRSYKVGTPENARKHVFKVRAIDAAGNQDKTPAKFKFTAAD
jgi:hypothetical protein